MSILYDCVCEGCSTYVIFSCSFPGDSNEFEGICWVEKVHSTVLGEGAAYPYLWWCSR